VHTLSALILQIIVIEIAVTVSSVKVVFDVTGGVGYSTISYLLPGLGYLAARRKFAKSERSLSCETVLDVITAYSLVIFYIIVLVLFFASKINPPQQEALQA